MLISVYSYILCHLSDIVKRNQHFKSSDDKYQNNEIYFRIPVHLVGVNKPQDI